MAGFKIVPRSAVGVGDVPQPMAQPFRGAAPSGSAEARIAALEENMRRMHGAYQQLAAEHQKLKTSTKGAVKQLISNDTTLAGHVEQVAVRVGYSPAPQGPGNTPGVPTHAIRNPNTNVQQQQAQQVYQQAGSGANQTVAPQAQPQNAQQAMQTAAEELFYGGDADALFYSGGEGE